jgi:ABC-2 type transport system permease protein
MTRTIILAARIVKQLRRDKRLLALSIAGPLVIIYFVKLFFDTLTLPPFVSKERYVIPFTAFIVHFISYVSCTIVVVQERKAGTLERLIISGVGRIEIIGGFLLGYFGLATLQAAVVLTEAILLFKLSYHAEVVALLFVVIWLLAVVSVLLGIFISTFARHEGQIFPFIPLIIVPSALFSGMILDVGLLPGWAQVLSRVLPLTYATAVIQGILASPVQNLVILKNLGILFAFILVLLAVASRTFKDTE